MLSYQVFCIFYVPGTSGLLLLIFPTYEVGVINLEGRDGETRV